MEEGSYIQIDQPCPACRAKLTCNVRVRLGFGVREPDYPVDCPTCHKRVRLDLPGPPIRIYPPRPQFPKFTRWPLERLGELLWRLVPPAVFKILEPQVDWEAVSKWLLNRRRAVRSGVQ